jgi:hypothetical protein
MVRFLKASDLFNICVLSVFKLVLSRTTKGSENVFSNTESDFSRILVRTDVLPRVRERS